MSSIQDMVCHQILDNQVSSISLFIDGVYPNYRFRLDALKVTNSVIYLTLHISHMDTETLAHICDVIKVNTSITQLEIQSNIVLTPDFLTNLCAALMVNNLVHILRIHYNITPVECQVLSEFFIRSPKLYTLYLQCRTMCLEGVQQLCEAIKMNGSLKGLGVHCIEPLECCQLVCDALKRNTQVTSFGFHYNRVGETGRRQLYDLLKVNTVITELGFTGQTLDTKDCLQLADVIKTTNTLGYLNLNDNNLNNEEQEPIWLALSTNQSIIKLELSNSDTTSRIFKRMCKTMETNATLCHMHGNGTGLILGGSHWKWYTLFHKALRRNRHNCKQKGVTLRVLLKS
jgi:hypothetical protein